MEIVIESMFAFYNENSISVDCVQFWIWIKFIWIVLYTERLSSVAGKMTRHLVNGININKADQLFEWKHMIYVGSDPNTHTIFFHTSIDLWKWKCVYLADAIDFCARWNRKKSTPVRVKRVVRCTKSFFAH